MPDTINAEAMVADNDKSKPCSIEKVEVLIESVQHLEKERWDGHRREHEMLADALRNEKQFVTEKMEALNELRRQVIEDRTQFVSKNIYESIRGEIERRINILESGKLSVSDAEKTERDVKELQHKGSDQARQALTNVHELQVRFDKLQLESASRGAVEDNRQELIRYRSRQVWLIAGNIIALCGVATAVIFGILAYMQARGGR